MPLAWQARLRWRPEITVEMLVLLASVFFALTANLSFWSTALPRGIEQWRLAPALLSMLLGVHGLLLGLLLHGRWARHVLVVLLFVTAGSTYYMQSYGVYLDADMLRNVLHTDSAESRELLSPGLGLHLLLFAALPGLLVWRLALVRRPLLRGMVVRAGFLLAMWVLMMLGAAVGFKELSALLRNQREVRYLVTPANYLYGLANLAFATPGAGDAPLLPVAEDARQLPPAATRSPRLLVLVVGETVRAQNWGMSGYARQTTPQLQGLDVVNFRNVQACGSSTEVSLPCMFSRLGRSRYDEGDIRTHQSLLHVLDRVGVDVLWRDNQSGCKDVCRDLPFESVAAATDPVLCDGLRCLDEILFKDLPEGKARGGDRILVLHMLGNHGPSYFQRYPAHFRQFIPTCDTVELGECTREQVTNSYDNAILYTDHLLATAIQRLNRAEGYDSALLYISDHGESLGENGLYLHGMPYAIAPREQMQVPMLMWFSPGFAADTGLDLQCLRTRAERPASHDDLFSTVLGMFDVRTTTRMPARDLLAGCRR